MKTNTHRPIFVEAVTERNIQCARDNKIPLLSSLLFGLLAYMFAFTNKLINHDEAGQLFGKGATISSGRWGLGALDSIFPNVSMPWIYGIITIGLIAVSICILIRIFSVRSKLLQVLLSGCIMVFPSLIGLFGYMFTSSSYAVSFFLAVLAVWFVQQGKIPYILAGLISLILSLSIYQSYISVAASLLVLLLIRRLLTEEDAGSILKQGIVYVLFLIAALALYYLATQLIFRIKHVAFNSYAADSITLSLSGIVNGIFLAYQKFFEFFRHGTWALIPTPFSRLIHGLLCLLFFAELLLWFLMQKKQRIGRILLLLLLLVLLPLSINCMYMITAEESIHTLVLYSVSSVYVLIIMLSDILLSTVPEKKVLDFARRGLLNMVSLAMAVVVVINIYIANAAFLNLHLRYENAYAFYSTLIADIKMTPDFSEDTKLAIIGNWKEPDYYIPQLEFSYYLTGIHGFLPGEYTQQAFMEYYLGFSIPFASSDEIAAITASPEFHEMPVYPYYGSMQQFDNILVVKLS